MGDDVAIVEDDPEIVLHSLGTQRLPAFEAHLFYYIVGYCVDVGGGISVADHEMVCD